MQTLNSLHSRSYSVTHIFDLISFLSFELLIEHYSRHSCNGDYCSFIFNIWSQFLECFTTFLSEIAKMFRWGAWKWWWWFMAYLPSIYCQVMMSKCLFQQAFRAYLYLLNLHLKLQQIFMTSFSYHISHAIWHL